MISQEFHRFSKITSFSSCFQSFQLESTLFHKKIDSISAELLQFLLFHFVLFHLINYFISLIIRKYFLKIDSISAEWLQFLLFHEPFRINHSIKRNILPIDISLTIRKIFWKKTGKTSQKKSVGLVFIPSFGSLQKKNG